MTGIVNFPNETSTEELGVVIRDQRVVVSSRDVARVFEKDHHKVLRDIRELGCIAQTNRIIAELAALTEENEKEAI